MYCPTHEGYDDMCPCCKIEILEERIKELESVNRALTQALSKPKEDEHYCGSCGTDYVCSVCNKQLLNE